MTTKVAIKQSAYDTSHLGEGWKKRDAHCDWPQSYHLRGGKYRTGEYFIFAASTNSSDMDDIAKADVFYGTGITIEVAEEEAYRRYLQNKQV